MFQSCKHTCPLPQKETDTLSSKAVVHYISIIEEMVFLRRVYVPQFLSCHNKDLE